MTDIGRLVRQANPVVDEATALTDDEVTALLLLADSRSTDMDMKELVAPAETGGPTRTGWPIAAASFAVVMAVVGATIVLGRGEPEGQPTPDDAVAATTTASPTTTRAVEPAESVISADDQAVLDEFVAAVNAADPAVIEAMLGPGFELTSGEALRSGFSAPADAASLQFAYYATEGSTFDLSDCKSTSSGIYCKSTWSGVVPTATFGQDLPGQELLTITDGRISSIRSTPFQSTVPWLTQGRLNLIEWVRTISPGDAETMENGEESYLGFRLEVAPLWRDYAERWLEAGQPEA